MAAIEFRNILQVSEIELCIGIFHGWCASRVVCSTEEEPSSIRISAQFQLWNWSAT